MARKALVPFVASGAARCSRCGLPIAAGEEWHLDHSDDRRSYLGPSHAACNLRAASAKAHALRQRPQRLSPMEAAELAAVEYGRRETAYWAEVEARKRREAERPTPRIF